MFESAIEKVLQFTRPLHTISRTYGGLVMPGSSTFFFVNNSGVAITCKHVADLIPQADKINNSYLKFKQDRNHLLPDNKYRKNLQGLELKYKFNKDSMIQLKNNFLNCFDKIDAITFHIHPTLDLAILEFKGFNKIYYNGCATFIKDSKKIKPGNYLCRVGFPFPEFNNFKHNPDNDDIEWTQSGNPNSPSFPLDGIVTRMVANMQGDVNGIEMSTPGLRGQSGGPVFDVEGNIYGMQFATKHLHLGFDMKEKEIIQDGKKTKVSNYPFLHVGLCVHVDKIKEFLSQHKISFQESK